jgi:Amidohydrolase family
MKRQSAIGFAAALLLGLGGPCLGAEKILVIHAGQLFDGKSDALSSNQVIIVQGDRIAEVGPATSVKIPSGAEVIDLGTGTVLPGLIEGHNHVFKIGDYPGTGSEAAVPAVIQPGTPFSMPYVTLLAAKNAKLDLMSGFTTARDLSSGSTADVDLRDAINNGIVEGPRMVVATEGMRGSTAGPRYFHLVDSPWEGRKQVRVQLKNGADFIKIYVNNLSPTPMAARRSRWRNSRRSSTRPIVKGRRSPALPTPALPSASPSRPAAIRWSLASTSIRNRSGRSSTRASSWTLR